MNDAVALVRKALPVAVVDAPGENGILWCSPSASVVLEEQQSRLLVQALSPQLDAAIGSPAPFSASDLPAEVASAIILRLAGEWQKPPTVQAVSKQSARGTCGADTRAGLDTGILVTQKRVEETHYWLRDQVGPLISPDDDPAAAMVQRYIFYLSTLVDTAQSSTACLAVHRLDRGVTMIQRTLAEYAVRARFAVSHPDHTLWRLTIAEALDFEKRLKDGGADSRSIAAAEAARIQTEARFAAVGELAKKARWKDLQFKTMFEYVASADQHASLYRWPSAFIHADPAGMRELFQWDAHGSTVVVPDLSDEDINTDLVDATLMLVEFLRAFRDAFPGLHQSEEAASRISELDRENRVHTLRFPKDRPAIYLEQVRSELGLAQSSPHNNL
ncbi:MAG TPA: DUF5677 domain-containing protein [Candidatus Baltobacteraceae bacterium]